MGQALISVVIAVHNNEQTLAACLDSILDQPAVANLELICINDRSTDNSRLIAYQRGITWLDAKGRGVGAARNTGIEQASGKYIWFVDADDELVPQALNQTVVELIKTNPADFYTLGVEKVYPKKTITIVDSLSRRYLIRDQKAASQLFTTNILNSSWNKLYDLAFIKRHQLAYPNYTTGEDAIFNYRYFLQAKTGMSIAQPMYHFNVFSVSSSKFYWKADQLMVAQEMVRLLLKVHQKTCLVSDELMFKTLIDTVLGNEANIAHKWVSWRAYRRQLQQPEMEYLRQTCRQFKCSVDWSYLLKYWLANNEWLSYRYIKHRLK